MEGCSFTVQADIDLLQWSIHMSGLCVGLCSTDRKDFSDDPLNVTFAAGSVVSSYASVDITDDNIMEENETFICVILKSTQFEKDDLLTEDPDVATIAILDSDGKSKLNIQRRLH